MSEAFLMRYPAGGVPSGIITFWSGASNAIPDGWALCNGQNGTPDLRDRFVVGAGNQYSVGNKGGAEAVTLTVEQMPAHSHGCLVKTSNVGWTECISPTTEATAGTLSTTKTGDGQAHENRPPYYALCYIMKT